MRFTKSPECADAYKAFMCYLNFPRCDGSGSSLLMCRSACENFFKACNYPKAMWRCGNPAYFGGEAPEPADVIDENGVPVYFRAPFPGLPFTANQIEGDGYTELPVCTPAIPGGAAAARLSELAIAAVVGAAVGLACLPGIWAAAGGRGGDG